MCCDQTTDYPGDTDPKKKIRPLDVFVFFMYPEEQRSLMSEHSQIVMLRS